MPDPLISFDVFVSGGRPPCRADASAEGTLPTRAFRFCEPIRAASSFGYYVFLPIEIQLVFDGVETIWSYDGGENWYNLSSAQYPNFAKRFDQHAPDDVKGYSPPFLTSIDDNSLLQVWTGVIARTRPDWSLLVRPPANFITSNGYRILEGIIETDRWYGPLFTNIKLLRNEPITLKASVPFIQVQPIHRATYDDDVLDQYLVNDDLTTVDWNAFHQRIVLPNQLPIAQRPLYAVEARKRRAKERQSGGPGDPGFKKA